MKANTSKVSIIPGNKLTCGASERIDLPWLIRFPQETVSCAPKPRKLRLDSIKIIPDSEKETETINGVQTLGNRCLNTILEREAPREVDAKIYSYSLDLRISALTIRPGPGHPVMTNTKIRLFRVEPSMELNARSKRMPGKARSSSVKKRNNLSIMPPIYPANSPNKVPITLVKKTVTKAI